jgi:hypothetical protein
MADRKVTVKVNINSTSDLPKTVAAQRDELRHLQTDLDKTKKSHEGISSASRAATDALQAQSRATDQLSRSMAAMQQRSSARDPFAFSLPFQNALVSRLGGNEMRQAAAALRPAAATAADVAQAKAEPKRVPIQVAEDLARTLAIPLKDAVERLRGEGYEFEERKSKRHGDLPVQAIPMGLSGAQQLAALYQKVPAPAPGLSGNQLLNAMGLPVEAQRHPMMQRYQDRATAASETTRKALEERQAIGTPQHVTAIREEIQARRQLAQNERMNRRIGQEVEFGKVGLAIRELGPHIENFGRISTRVFAAGAAAIGMMVRAGSPETWQTLWGNFRLLAGEIGNQFIPQIVRVAGWIRQARDWVVGLDDTTKRNIATWAAWGIGIAGVGMVLSRLAPVARIAMSGLSMLAAHPVAAGLLAIAGASGLLEKGIAALPAMFTTAKQAISGLTETQLKWALGIGGAVMMLPTVVRGLSAVNTWMATTSVAAAAGAGRWAMLGTAVSGVGKAIWGFTVAHPVIAGLTAITLAVGALTRGFGLLGSSSANALDNLQHFQHMEHLAAQLEGPGPISFQQQVQALGPARAHRLQQAQAQGPAAHQHAITAMIAEEQAIMQGAVGPAGVGQGGGAVSEEERRRMSLVVMETLNRPGVGVLSRFAGMPVLPLGTSAASHRRDQIQRALIAAGFSPQVARAEAQRLYQHSDNPLSSGFLGAGDLSQQQIQQVGQLITGPQHSAQAALNALFRLQQLAGGRTPNPALAAVAGIGGVAGQFQATQPMTFAGMNVPQHLQGIARPYLFQDMQARQVQSAGDLHDIIQNDSIRSEGHQQELMMQLRGLERLLEQLVAHAASNVSASQNIAAQVGGAGGAV